MKLIDYLNFIRLIEREPNNTLQARAIDAIRQMIISSNIDTVQVVRCKNCKYWRDKQILLDDGTYRDYEPGEYENGSLLGCGVTSDIGINVGSRCMRREFSGDSWWCGENDFCSYGEAKDE